MIIINPQLEGKNYVMADNKTFPHLFRWVDELNEYEQISKFWWEFDENYNLVVETMLDAEELRIEMLKVLNKQKEFAEIIIDKEQKKLAAINNILKGVQNG